MLGLPSLPTTAVFYATFAPNTQLESIHHRHLPRQDYDPTGTSYIHTYLLVWLSYPSVFSMLTRQLHLTLHRHLTGQPQPPHDHAPVKRKHKEPEGASGSAHTTSSIARTAGSSSSWALGTAAAGGISGSASASARPSNLETPSSAHRSSSKQRRDAIPLDDEFAHTVFQGPLSH
jgi:hypothetical protein